MRQRLAKLAAISAQLRNAVLLKEAGLFTATAKGVGSVALKNPGKAALVGFGGAAGVKGFKDNKQQFQDSMAPTPLPPG